MKDLAPKNMVHKFLYTSEEVCKAIAEIFRVGKHRRRIALSAYVGDSAEYYLPFPDKLEVVCSPTAGATSPNAIRKLISLGATVQFVDKLHMKVYWSEGVGAVVTSANLSTNAMGFGGLREAGVLLGPEFVDIAKLLKPLQRRPAEPELHDLDLANREYFKRNPRTGRSHSASFADWYTSVQRESWKLLVCEEYSDDGISQASKDHSRREMGFDPENWAWSSERAAVNEHEWVLCAGLRREDKDSFAWLFVDHVEKVSSQDKAFLAKYPYELVQVRPIKTYAPPPFAVDFEFKKAFWKTAERLGIKDETPSPVAPSSKVLDFLHSILAK